MSVKIALYSFNQYQDRVRPKYANTSIWRGIVNAMNDGKQYASDGVSSMFNKAMGQAETPLGELGANAGITGLAGLSGAGLGGGLGLIAGALGAHDDPQATSRELMANGMGSIGGTFAGGAAGTLGTLALLRKGKLLRQIRRLVADNLDNGPEVARNLILGTVGAGGAVGGLSGGIIGSNMTSPYIPSSPMYRGDAGKTAADLL